MSNDHLDPSIVRFKGRISGTLTRRVEAPNGGPSPMIHAEVTFSLVADSEESFNNLMNLIKMEGKNVNVEISKDS